MMRARSPMWAVKKSGLLRGPLEGTDQVVRSAGFNARMQTRWPFTWGSTLENSHLAVPTVTRNSPIRTPANHTSWMCTSVVSYATSSLLPPDRLKSTWQPIKRTRSSTVDFASSDSHRTKLWTRTSIQHTQTGLWRAQWTRSSVQSAWRCVATAIR